MKNYKFRGKVSYNGNHYHSGDWVYGYYWTNELGNHFIRRTIDQFENYILEDVEVIPETVGQWTSFLDVDKVEIYEGDIVESSDYGYGHNRPVMVKMNRMYYYDGEEFISDNIKIIGNIHDNKELVLKYNL